jgi:hypothetical protein
MKKKNMLKVNDGDEGKKIIYVGVYGNKRK